MRYFQKEGLLFLPWNLQWKLVNFLICHHSFSGEDPPKIIRKLLQSSRPPVDYKAIVSSCPTCQLNNPQGAQSSQLGQPIWSHGDYAGEDWQMNFTQMPVSQEYDPAASAAMSLQLCPTLCDPIDDSPLGSSVPGILQARILEWVAISFCNAWKWKV